MKQVIRYSLLLSCVLLSMHMHAADASVVTKNLGEKTELDVRVSVPTQSVSRVKNFAKAHHQILTAAAFFLLRLKFYSYTDLVVNFPLGLVNDLCAEGGLLGGAEGDRRHVFTAALWDKHGGKVRTAALSTIYAYHAIPFVKWVYDACKGRMSKNDSPVDPVVTEVSAQQ